MVMMGMVGVAFTGAFRADSLGHVVYALHLETVGISHLGYGKLFQTECAVAHLAMKMHVAVIIYITVRVA